MTFYNPFKNMICLRSFIMLGIDWTLMVKMLVIAHGHITSVKLTAAKIVNEFSI